MNPPSLPPAPTDIRRLQILEAARRLLIRHGFQDIALDEVAREADVAKGTLFLYFRSKEDLFTAVFGDLVDQLRQKLEVLIHSGRTGLALLEETVRTILVHFEKNRDFTSHFSAGKFPGCGAHSCAKLADKMSENLERVSQILDLCLDPPIPDSKKRYASIALMGLCRSALLQKLLDRSASPLERGTTKVTGFFLHGVRDKT